MFHHYKIEWNVLNVFPKHLTDQFSPRYFPIRFVSIGFVWLVIGTNYCTIILLSLTFHIYSFHKMAPDSEKENPYAKIPNCIIYSLMIFTFVLILIGGGLVWMFHRMIGRYEFVQNLIDQTPSSDMVLAEIVNSQSILDKKRDKEYLPVYDNFQLISTVMAKRTENLYAAFKKAVSDITRKKDGNQNIYESYQRLTEKSLRDYKRECDGLITNYKNRIGLSDESIKVLDESVEKFQAAFDKRKASCDNVKSYEARHLLPQDFVYLKLYDQPGPSELWKDCNWREIDTQAQEAFLYFILQETGKITEKQLVPKEECQKNCFTHELADSKQYPSEKFKFTSPRSDLSRDKAFGITLSDSINNYLDPTLPATPVRLYRKVDDSKAWKELD